MTVHTAELRAKLEEPPQAGQWPPREHEKQYCLNEVTRYLEGKEEILTTTPECLATVQRPLVKDLEERGLKKPGLARANVAATLEKPQGLTAGPHLKMGKTRTVMQQHVDFFDRNNDGIITMWDTYIGFRRIGFSILFSIWAVFVVNPAFSLVSSPGWFPDPFLRIFTKNIHRGKHGSDQKVYDQEGRFIPRKYEEIFSKWDHDNKGGLSLRDIWEMTQSTREANDFFGWFAGKFEWITTWLATADHRGLVTKEAIRSVYDGSLFYKLEEKWWHKKTGLGDYEHMGEGATLSAIWNRWRGKKVKGQTCPPEAEPHHVKSQ